MKLIGFVIIFLVWSSAFGASLPPTIVAQQAPEAAAQSRPIDDEYTKQGPLGIQVLPELCDKSQDIKKLRDLIHAQTEAIKALSNKVDTLEKRVSEIERRGH